MRFLIILIALISSCAHSVSTNESPERKSPATINKDSLDRISIDSIIKSKFNSIGLVDIKEFDSRILLDLKYASNDNFMHIQLYDSIRSVYLQHDVALRLSKVQNFLDSLKPGFRLLVYDGVRPLLVQQEMWLALDSIPALERGKFVSNPVWGSVHNYGAAVDLTIANEEGIPLDMGAGYDDIREIAYPSKETEFLKSGELSREQYENRRLLRKVMRSQQFTNIPTEWWHFNAYSRYTASKLFKQLLSESGDAREFIVVLPDSIKVDSTAIGL